jgi:putative oxidoreductase
MNRTDLALLIIRSVFGVFMLLHGVNKIRSGLGGTAGWFGSIGMRRPALQARTAAWTEIGAGALFAAIISVMCVAIITVHLKVGFFIFLPGGGWEYCASIAAVAAAVAVAGPGSASLDDLLGWTTGPVVGVLAVAVGLAAAACHLALSWRPGATQ